MCGCVCMHECVSVYVYVCRALSMGVHESQSLFWERMVFQSAEFWEWCTPIIHKHFPHTAAVDHHQFYRFVNQVHNCVLCCGVLWCHQHCHQLQFS